VNKKLVLSVLSTAVVASMAASAMAKPNAGFYVGGNVDKYYSIDSFLNHLDTALDEIIDNLDSTTFVDENGKAAPFLSALNAQTEEELSAVTEPARLDHFENNPYTIVDGTGVYNPEEDEDLLAPDPGELKVESVSAINLNQIKVTFNAVVDEDSATNAANYLINGTSLDTNGTAPDDTLELTNDGKSVIISLDSRGQLTNNSPLTVRVTGVKSATDKVVEAFEETILVKDSVAPAVQEAKVNATNNGFVVTFDEPVQVSGVAKVNGVPATISAGPDKYSINVAASLTSGQTYTVYVSGVKDLAGNSAAATTKSVTYNADIVAPTLESITQKDDKTLKIKFSEQLDSSSLPNVTVYRGTNIFFNGTLTTLDITDKTNTTYLVTLNPNAGGSSQVLYPAGQNTANVTVDVASFKDKAGNVAAATSKSVTLTKSTTAPVVTATKWDGTNVIVTFDKTLDHNSEVASKLLITDETGAEVTATAKVASDTTGTDADGKYVIISGLTADKTYTINFLAGFAKDKATVPNETAAYSFTIKTPSTAGDTTAPAVETNAARINAELGGTANPKVDTTANVIRVLFTEEVAASATNLSNYKLDGASLPEGSVVTLEKGRTTTNKNLIAKITLPADAIAYDGNYELTISGVKDLAGNASKAETLVVGLKDTVAPVLQSAKIQADNTLLLTFSENIQSSSLAGGERDFAITVNGVTLNGGYTTVDDAVYNDNKFKIVFSNVNVVGQSVTVATYGTPSVVRDNSQLHNTLKTDVSVNATN
jgi:hypothetical protein